MRLLSNLKGGLLEIFMAICAWLGLRGRLSLLRLETYIFLRSNVLPIYLDHHTRNTRMQFFYLVL